MNSKEMKEIRAASECLLYYSYFLESVSLTCVQKMLIAMKIDGFF